jgi:hypothetical protein
LPLVSHPPQPRLDPPHARASRGSALAARCPAKPAPRVRPHPPAARFGTDQIKKDFNALNKEIANLRKVCFA